MKQEIKLLQKAQKIMRDNMYPGYPYQDSIIIDLENNQAYDHYGRKRSKDKLLKEIYADLLYQVVGHTESTKRTFIQDRHISNIDHFTDSRFDIDELYIDSDLAARFYLAIQSALCEIYDNKITKGFMFACMDADCDYIEVKIFTELKEVNKFVKEYFEGEEVDDEK